jgi:hypothetical protein
MWAAAAAAAVARAAPACDCNGKHNHLTAGDEGFLFEACFMMCVPCAEAQKAIIGVKRTQVELSTESKWGWNTKMHVIDRDPSKQSGRENKPGMLEWIDSTLMETPADAWLPDRNDWWHDRNDWWHRGWWYYDAPAEELEPAEPPWPRRWDEGHHPQWGAGPW